MSKSHSSVLYVEPNLSAVGKNEINGYWKVEDNYERAPRLEDYCITVNLEVELCGRDNIVNDNKQPTKVLIMSYSTTQGGSGSTVSFWGGTKISTHDNDNSSINYLTTNYADMYVGDLVNYGTSEMVGIKSIDIDFQKSCVPLINIKFTDVRGLSIYQPTELSRTNSFQGIGGINADNVAESFFQCFWRVPKPKFTITIKGFYGRPVTYEMLCDQYTTRFNSSTGDFDFDARFIGYSYSFLTDVVMDALMVAPYSDYGGRGDGTDYNTYWIKEINNGRFTIPNKDGTSQDKMPTLFEMYDSINRILKDTDIDGTAATEEAITHSDEIDRLTKLKALYSKWYTALYYEACKKYGKDYVYLFKKNGYEYRLLILTNENTTNEVNLSDFYRSLPDEFQNLNTSLSTAVKTFNEREDAFKQIDGVSFDFSDYKRTNLFNKFIVNYNGDIVFMGFVQSNTLPQADTFNQVFNSNISSGETASSHAALVRRKIYNDGISQYIDCYVIDVEYESVGKRIDALQNMANRNTDEIEHEERLKAINKAMLAKMNWYPSVENFTKIMMAHLETLMRQLYDCVNKCNGRKASELGVNPNENLDVNVKITSEDPVIPPFPRVYKPVVGEDNITKNEDTWVGEFGNSKGFEEVDFINGLFNGAEKVVSLFNDSEMADSERERENTQESEKPIIPHPLSSFDFYITKSPYGSSEDIANDVNCRALSGKIAIRMFDILGINYLRQQLKGNFYGIRDAETVGKVEADNFYNLVRITNSQVITKIKSSEFNAKQVLDIIQSKSDDNPWGNQALFGSDLWLDGYKTEGDVNYIYPIQDMSFDRLNECHSCLNSGKITSLDGDISLWKAPRGVNDNILRQGDSNCGYGTVYIRDDSNAITAQINGNESEENSAYTEIRQTIMERCGINENVYKIYTMITNVEGTHSFSVPCGKNISKGIKIHYPNDGSDISIEFKDDSMPFSYINHSQDGGVENIFNSGDFSEYTISEIFSIKNGFSIERGSSLINYYIYATRNDKPLKIHKLKGKSLFALSNDGAWATMVIMCTLLNTRVISEYLNANRTITYLPRLTVLQIGAIIYASGGSTMVHNSANDIRNKAQKYIPVASDVDYDNGIFKFIYNLNPLAKCRYEEYFKNWVENNSSWVKNIFTYDTKYARRCNRKSIKEISKNPNAKTHTETAYTPIMQGANGSVVAYSTESYKVQDGPDGSFRELFNENDAFVKRLTKEFLTPITVVRLSVNHQRNGFFTKRDCKIERGIAEKYLKGFIGRLKEHYGKNETTDENGNIVRTTDEPNKTTTDMKIELYRYMVQLYNKWVPMASFDDWKIESFFIKDKGKEERGHKFYFIDSYYNDIGQKLLINPKMLADRIRTLLDYQDINSMLLGFMADIYSANKSMLMTIQNFADLRKKEAMNEMFTPLSYNSIKWADINKYPSFVVVYPYQASQHLSNANGEYKDDGFMLNDEFDTPLAIRTKRGEENGHYLIPAFGVSYGKQYQSYFKNVNVNSSSPIATEQSIKAKHAILRRVGAQGEKGVVSQDLYDVYASQSYTCDVEMVGCAWVQPLMYFVLLNIPMFRGSYMIMKVRHSIRPGDMSTTFTGCRMANTSNPIIENIFTDEDISNSSTSALELERIKNEKADVDNDCPYKVYPLWSEGDGPDYSSELGRKVQQSDCASSKEYGYLKNYTIQEAIARIATFESGSNGHIIHKLLELAIMYNRRCKYGNYKTAIFKQGQFDIKKAPLNDSTPSAEVLDAAKNMFTYGPSWMLSKYKQTKVTYQHEVRVGSSKMPKGSQIKSTVINVEDLQKIVYTINYDEYTHKKNQDIQGTPEILVQDSLNSVYGTIFTSDKDEKRYWEAKPKTSKKEDIKTAFIKAVNNSAKDTPSIGIELSSKTVGKYIQITQKDGKTNKLCNIFDLIINSEYYNYVQGVGITFGNGGLETDMNPKNIYCEVVESPKANAKTIWVNNENSNIGMRKNIEIPTQEGGCNPKLLKVLAKKRNSIGNDNNFQKEVPQIKNAKGLDKYMPTNCDNLIGDISGDGGTFTDMHVTDVACNIKNGYIGDWNVAKSADWLLKQTTEKSHGKCWAYVKRCLTASGDFSFISGDYAYKNIDDLIARGFVCIKKGTMKGHQGTEYGTPCIGDITIFYPYRSKDGYHKAGHANMWCGKQWVSDFRQKGNWVNSSAEGKFVVMRYSGKGKR